MVRSKNARPFAAITLVAMVGFAAFQSTARAAVVQPCASGATGGTGGITILPINGGNQTYCQTAYGWSDTWFATSQPAAYDQHLDVLSGDNAPALIYRTATEEIGSGNQYNIISPWLDGGSLNAQYLGSDWEVVNDIVVNGNQGTSTITLNGLDATITTTVGLSGVTEAFRFVNNTADDIVELVFSDYFNFHPNGSDPGDIDCPSTSYNAGTGMVTTTGANSLGCAALVPQGVMWGSMLPTTWDLGLATGVLLNMSNNTFNQALGPVQGDGAAVLVWNLGRLNKGESVEFTIHKDTVVPEAIPAPGSIALLSIGLVGLWKRRPRGAGGRV